MSASDWTRRAFLTRSSTTAGVLAAGAGAIAAGAAACSSGSGSPDGDSEDLDDLDLDDWDSVRAQFSLSPDHRHFDAWLVGANPRPVADAITRYRDELDREPWKAMDEYAARDATARRVLAGFVGGEPSDVALTDGTVQGLGLVYSGIRLAPDHEILTTVHEDYVTQEAVRLAARRSWSTVRQARLFDRATDASADEIVVRLLGEVGPNTRVVALTWVLPNTGLKLPIPEIAEALAGVNRDRAEEDHVLLCVDGGYVLGVEEVDASQLGCDFLAAGLDHWMFGPRGTGVCWGRSSAWQRLEPIFPSSAPTATEAWIAGDDPPEPLSGVLATPAGNHNVEHRWAMPSAVHFQEAIGRAEAASWTLDQAADLKEGLSSVDGITLLTPADQELSSALVCFRPERQDPHELIARMRRRYVMASLAPSNPQIVRLGPSLATGPDDVEEAVATVGDLA